MKKDITYSEIFGDTFQGEGHFTGVPTVWIRFFLCNLQCDGFGQDNPTKPETWTFPYKDFDLIDIKRVEDLPVFEQGCDSSYTWAKRYKHLMKSESVETIVDKLTALLCTDTNEDGMFLHPRSMQDTHMAFTGGEPMLNQPAIIAIMKEFESRGNVPKNVTIETNGTKKISADLIDLIADLSNKYGTKFFWSVSPKLWSTAGEKSQKAIKPDLVAGYSNDHADGQLKFVVNGTKESWDEVEAHLTSFRQAGVQWPVWIMPIGATKEQQEGKPTADIAVEAIRRGYNVSGRMHCYIFGNAIGT